MQAPSVMPVVLALVSGKGGSGKTSVAIALGHLLADLGFRVTIVDADPATRGMTYFFADQLHAGPRGLLETPSPEAIRIGDGELYFVPLIGSVETDVNAYLIDQGIKRMMEPTWVRQTFAAMDFVLLDCQAGYAEMVTTVVRTSDTAVIITEADPVSIYAVNVLRRQLAKELYASHLPGGFLGVVNKIFPEEANYYQAIVDITSEVKFVAQLPFDADVRRSFFRREPPIDLERPNPFVLALSDAARQLTRRSANESTSQKIGESRSNEMPLIPDTESYLSWKKSSTKGWSRWTHQSVGGDCSQLPA